MRSSQNPEERFKVLRPIILLLLVSLVFSLIFFGYQGAFSRLMADDYCYAAKGRDLGLFQGLWDIYTTWSGRYSSIFLILVIEPLLEGLVKVLPAILLLVWLGSLIRLIINIQNRMIEKLPHWYGWTAGNPGTIPDHPHSTQPVPDPLLVERLDHLHTSVDLLNCSGRLVDLYHWDPKIIKTSSNRRIWIISVGLRWFL